MKNVPVYALLAIFFILMAKFLQVYAFDGKKYGANKEKFFARKPITSIQTKKARDKHPAVKKQMKKEEKNTEGEAVADTTYLSEDVENSTKTTGLDALKKSYLKPILSGLPEGHLREDVVVRYYKHEKDGDQIYALKDMGYYIHEKEPIETIGLSSNVIYYGKDVPTEDIQIISYFLLQSGYTIKAIEPSRFSWKNNAIEIGSDRSLEGRSAISRTEIDTFSK